MKAHIFQHVAFEDIGSIAPWLEKRGIAHDYTKFFEKNCALPQLKDIDLLIVMGGPMGVHDESIYTWLREEKEFIRAAIDAGKYVLGICLGAQLIAHVLGAEVKPNTQKEIGWFPIAWRDEALALSLLRGFNSTQIVFHWHGDTFALPKNAMHLAQSEACVQQAFLYRDKVLGLQFHMETTRDGLKDLYEHCQQELAPPGPFIQTSEQMAKFSHYFPQLETGMHRLLSNWLKA